MSLPLCLSAKTLNVKIYLFEPNMVIGRSNKFFLKFSEKIICYSNKLRNFPKVYANKIIDVIPTKTNLTLSSFSLSIFLNML